MRILYLSEKGNAAKPDFFVVPGSPIANGVNTAVAAVAVSTELRLREKMFFAKNFQRFS
ncbi:hypothetical protein ACFOPN_09325 [Xanthomonas hyacinthi]|uniref:hypothetical protein n=1 Tax=Xanthomonas hyacinthi TaxID=56455 RepID=UPI000AD63641|nr:hypothetical protein [Xanthomonas hyacinthi]